MSVSKNLDIRLLRSEKKSLVAFLSLYLFFSIIILFFIVFLYYSFQKDLMLQKKREYLQEYSKDFVVKLKRLHRNFSKTHIYPTDKNIRTAIYDSDKVKIFSLLKRKPDLKKVIYKTGDQIQFIKEPESYYLGAKYIIFEMEDDGIWFKKFIKNILMFGFPFFIVIMIMGYFLMRLFLKPMRDTVVLLDRFIKDTTHELNTPVSAIMANIETIDKNKLEPKTLRKIERIDIAARTISNIYQDLTYLVLNHRVQTNDERMDISKLLKDRCEYFSIIAKSKKIEFILDIQDGVYLDIDKNKMIKLIDNLISNAIKYNKIKGKIKIVLREGSIIVEDTGIGISEDKLNEIFDRYKRFNTSSGGFGIGLNIVWMIAKEYNLKIKVDSKVGKYTKVEIRW